MKVWKRVLVKVIIFLLVVLAAGGGAACYRAYQQSTPEYAVNKYLTSLIDNQSQKAYALLDQSEDGELSLSEYAGALEAKKYSLYSSYNLNELEKRRDSSGNEYVDYHAEFLNADGEVQTEEDFTVKKQSDAVFGIFDSWKTLSSHCLIKNLQITVPAGSQVYLDGEEADASWIIQADGKSSLDCYQIPSILPGKISLIVRHPALESVNTTLDTTGGDADYSAQMGLKSSAQDELKELGVSALKQLYAAAATQKTEGLEELFGGCQETAEQFADDQGNVFHSESSVFKNAAISDFAAQFGDVVFTEEENGSITVEMTFSYHYIVRSDVTTDTGEVQEDGTPVQETETSSQAGDNTAKFVMAFYEDQWHIASMEIPAIPGE